MTPAGEFKYLLPTSYDPPRGLSMWRDRAGNTFAWERNDANLKQGAWLVRRSPDGAVTRLAGSDYGHADGRGDKASFGIARFNALGPDGSFYVTDGSYVRRIAPDGTVTTLAANIRVDGTNNPEEKGAPAYLSGISVDPQGFVYVADSSNGRVIKIAPDRKIETVLLSERPWSPRGVTASGGALYVLEDSATTPQGPFYSRVRRLAPDGTSTVLAAVVDGKPAQPDIKPAAAEAPAASPALDEARTRRGTCFTAGVLVVSLFAWSVRRRAARGGE
jgi:sugar lactone lactonase YvrE